MDEHDASAADLSDEERRFILQIGEVGLVGFEPREDELIAHLLDLAFVDAERVDDQIAIIRLTREGHVIAARLRDNLG